MVSFTERAEGSISPEVLELLLVKVLDVLDEIVSSAEYFITIWTPEGFHPGVGSEVAFEMVGGRSWKNLFGVGVGQELG